MDVIETLKTLGAILGPVLAALALLWQRLNESKRAQIDQEMGLSEGARKWAQDFRDEMARLRDESTRLHQELDDAKCQLIDQRAQIRDLEDRVEELTQAKEQLQAALTALRGENQRLREEVVVLRNENTKLRQTVEQQAKRIAQLEGGTNGASS